MDRGNVVIGFVVAVMVVGTILPVWGYRADGKRVPFSWDRYWHWWRVSMLCGILGAPIVVLFAWLVYWGQPPGWVFGTAAGAILLLVPLMAFSHWRLWFPLMVMGRIVLGPHMPRGVYLRQSLRTFGYSFGLGLAGCLVVAVAGRVISG
jgi:hypothetical protein